MHPPRTSPDPSALLQPSRGLASSPRSSRSSGSLLSRLLLGASARRSHTHTHTHRPADRRGGARRAGRAMTPPTGRPSLMAVSVLRDPPLPECRRGIANARRAPLAQPGGPCAGIRWVTAERAEGCRGPEAADWLLDYRAKKVVAGSILPRCFSGNLPAEWGSFLMWVICFWRWRAWVARLGTMSYLRVFWKPVIKLHPLLSILK